MADIVCKHGCYPWCPECGDLRDGPPCETCQEWHKTGRHCDLRAMWECDCPKCQGMCECEEDLDD
jgi:hypothetical protein